MVVVKIKSFTRVAVTEPSDVDVIKTVGGIDFAIFALEFFFESLKFSAVGS